jgi:hypothetical protein
MAHAWRPTPFAKTQYMLCPVRHTRTAPSLTSHVLLARTHQACVTRPATACGSCETAIALQLPAELQHSKYDHQPLAWLRVCCLPTLLSTFWPDQTRLLPTFLPDQTRLQQAETADGCLHLLQRSSLEQLSCKRSLRTASDASVGACMQRLAQHAATRACTPAHRCWRANHHQPVSRRQSRGWFPQTPKEVELTCTLHKGSSGTSAGALGGPSTQQHS